ncbi:hypothetical protein KI387_028531, partial [Taxus chinensis]
AMSDPPSPDPAPPPDGSNGASSRVPSGLWKNVVVGSPKVTQSVKLQPTLQDGT